MRCLLGTAYICGRQLQHGTPILGGPPQPRLRAAIGLGGIPLTDALSQDLPVEAATWLAFYLCPGDHRFAIIDFKTDVLVGDNVLKVVHPAARRLSCAVPKAVTTYIQRLTTFVSTHNLLPRLHQLCMERNGDFTQEQAARLQSLDVARVCAMQRSDVINSQWDRSTIPRS